MLMIGAAGLAVDCANLFRINSKLQSAADAAALAGAAAGKKYAAENGVDSSVVEQIRSVAEDAAKAYFTNNAGASWPFVSTTQIASSQSRWAEK